jgi:hypothetical protein
MIPFGPGGGTMSVLQPKSARMAVASGPITVPS